MGKTRQNKHASSGSHPDRLADRGRAGVAAALLVLAIASYWGRKLAIDKVDGPFKDVQYAKDLQRFHEFAAARWVQLQRAR